MFVCVSTDPSRDCTSRPTRASGQGTCNDTTHVCTAGTPEPDGTPCSGSPDAGAARRGQRRVQERDVHPGALRRRHRRVARAVRLRQRQRAGHGLRVDCTFSCRPPRNSCPMHADICGGPNTCTAVTVGRNSGQKCEPGGRARSERPALGAQYAARAMNGSVPAALCGNDIVDPGEQCDWGTGNGPGSGCNRTARSRAPSPNSCPQADPCTAATRSASPVTSPTGHNGQKCQAGHRRSRCARCVQRAATLCVNKNCQRHVCGDGCLVPPETCDPPNGTTCDANCNHRPARLRQRRARGQRAVRRRQYHQPRRL